MPIFTLHIWTFSLSPTYYGLMYVISFISCYLVVKRRKVFSLVSIDNLLLFIFFWIILWGRLGYVLFYDIFYYLKNPFDIIKFWQGGMSFHGGAIWVILAVMLFAKQEKKSFFFVIDHIASVVPIGIFFWRIGNYINKELLWFPYNWFLAVEKKGEYFFPSPLIESFLEGFVLYFILAFAFKKKKFDGQIGSLFLIFYGIFRIFVEIFFRVPDPQIGYILWFLTMGMILSFPMIIFWIWFYVYLSKKK